MTVLTSAHDERCPYRERLGQNPRRRLFRGDHVFTGDWRPCLDHTYIHTKRTSSPVPPLLSHNRPLLPEATVQLAGMQGHVCTYVCQIWQRSAHLRPLQEPSDDERRRGQQCLWSYASRRRPWCLQPWTHSFTPRGRSAYEAWLSPEPVGPDWATHFAQLLKKPSRVMPSYHPWPSAGHHCQFRATVPWAFFLPFFGGSVGWHLGHPVPQ